MDLKEHKNLVWQYEQKLDELSALRAAAKDSEPAWCATYQASLDHGPYLVEIPIPPELASQLLLEHTLKIECEADAMAKRLGITPA